MNSIACKWEDYLKDVTDGVIDVTDGVDETMFGIGKCGTACVGSVGNEVCVIVTVADVIAGSDE